MRYLTKTDQWTRAYIVMRELHRLYPTESNAEIDRMAVTRLQNVRPTWPWEYPWSEVVRSQRERCQRALNKIKDL